MTNNKLKMLLKLLRPKHYLKNIIIFLPVLLSMNFFNTSVIIKELAIFASFCLIASAVYVFNDLFDLENDKKHPIKCNRPLASGAVSKTSACILFVVLVCVSLFLALKINLLSFIAVLSYLILNIFYTIKLKDSPLLDVVCIAFGFILRILAGCFAITVKPSPLVVLMTFFASMFFTFLKRKLEVGLIQDETQRRKALKGFDSELVNQFVQINAILAIAFYFSYVTEQQTILRAGTEYLYVTAIPFTLIIFRLLYISHKNNPESPLNFFEKDIPLQLLFATYLLSLFIVVGFSFL